MVQKAVNAEAMAGLRSSIMVQDLNTHCPKGYRPSHNTFFKVQTQGSSHKNSPRSEKPKPKNPKPALSCDNAAELAKKKYRKKKKKRLRNQKWEHTEQTLATGINIKGSKKKIKARCFNYNKKGHYTNECTKLSKN